MDSNIDGTMRRSVVIGMLAMATVVVASNILVQFLLGNWLTWGAFVYPIAFLVNDIMNRVYGPVAARKVVAAGFMVGIVCSLIGTQIEGEYGPLVTFRIAVGSGCAFLIAQLLDVSIFDMLRRSEWWKAPLVSTLVGSMIDTFLFFSIAFSSLITFIEPTNDVGWANVTVAMLGFGPEMPLWASLAFADLMIKLAFSLIMLGPFRMLSSRLITVPHSMTRMS